MTRGYKRYFKLFEYIKNPFEYIFQKAGLKKLPLSVATKPNDVRFSVPESLYLLFKEIFLMDVYDIKKIAKRTVPNPIVVDIGANAGFFDYLLLSQVPGATIYAYEPLPGNIQMIKESIKNNPQLRQSIHLFESAVAGPGHKKLPFHVENTAHSQVVASLFPDFNARNTSSIEVEVTTLAEILESNQLHQVDILKIDCEGAEFDILYNTPGEVFERIRFITMEVHNLDDQENNLESLVPYLENRGFDLSFFPINDFCFGLEATKRAAHL